MSDHEHQYHIHESYPYNYTKEWDGDEPIVFGATWLCSCGVWKHTKYFAKDEIVEEATNDPTN